MTTDAPSYDLSIHSNPDARAWAAFFMETWRSSGGQMGINEETMLGWFANAMCAAVDADRASRAASAPTPDLAPWYEADGSTVMLPTEEVERKRKAAAVVLDAARALRRAFGYSVQAGDPLLPSESVALLDLRDALDALDAAGSAPGPEGHAHDPDPRDEVLSNLLLRAKWAEEDGRDNVEVSLFGVRSLVAEIRRLRSIAPRGSGKAGA